jgi:hypothetical protein
LGLAVERGATFHIGRHIRDVHANAHFAVIERLERERVVEIFRIVGIDGERGHLAIIEAAGKLRRAHSIGKGGGFALDLGGKLRVEVELLIHAEQFGARLEGPAEPLRELAREGIAAAGPGVEFHHDLVAGCGRGLARRPGRIAHHHCLLQAWIVGQHEKGPARALQRADDGLLGAFQHAGHAAGGFGTAAVAARLPMLEDAHGHPVAMEGDIGILGGDLDRLVVVALADIVRDHEGGAARAKFDMPGDFALGAAQTQPVALHADEFAGDEEPAHLVGEGGTIFFGDAEAPGKLSFVGGPVGGVVEMGT